MLDAMDVMLYSMVLAELMVHLGISKAQAGMLNSLTLAASAVGGMAFGVIADRAGRTRALMGSILVYSLASFACGLSQTLTQLAACRVVLGLGMGGSGRPGRRSSPRPGPRSTAARPSGSCSRPGRSAR